MRGAQPDAECPRCNHRQPPAGALVTCLKCGLAFPPKELQRSSKPSRPPVDAIALAQPADLTIDTAGESLTFRWTDHGLMGFVWIGVSAILTLLVWSSMLSFFDKLGYTAFLLGLFGFGVFQARRKPHVQLDRARLTAGPTTLLLADITRIDVDDGRIIAVTRYEKSLEIATARDPAIAAYVGDAIARRLGQTD